MQRTIRSLRAALAFGALGVLGVLGAAAPALTGPQVGQPAPDFTLTTLDGKRVRLSDYRGKTLVLNVWATWCPPCREETPDLITAYGRLRGAQVAFLGVDDTEQAPIVHAFVADKGLPYPIAIDRDMRFSKAYDIRYFPTTYVIDPQGIVRVRNIDVVTSKQLAAYVATARKGENVRVVSPQQRSIDAALALSAFPAPAAGAGRAQRLAYAKRANAAIGKAEDVLNESTQAVDFLTTRAEESALRTRVIAALAPAANGDVVASALLATMRGDEAYDREHWSEAIADYRQALRYRNSDVDALNGLELAASAAKDAQAQIFAAYRLTSLAPGSVDAQIDLGVTYQKYRRYPKAIAALRRAKLLAMEDYARQPADFERIRAVATTHLFLGRAYVAAGAKAQARDQFEQLLTWARRLPAWHPRHAMYLEEGSEAIAALDLGAQARTAKASITLAPWTGAELPGSVSGSIKYRLLMTGAPNSTMSLKVASALPQGWIASFCTGRLCSPFRAQVMLPQAGVASIEFQVLRNEDPRPDRATVRIDALDGAAKAHATTVVDFTRKV